MSVAAKRVSPRRNAALTRRISGGSSGTSIGWMPGWCQSTSSSGDQAPTPTCRIPVGSTIKPPVSLSAMMEITPSAMEKSAFGVRESHRAPACCGFAEWADPSLQSAKLARAPNQSPRSLRQASPGSASGRAMMTNSRSAPMNTLPSASTQ